MNKFYWIATVLILLLASTSIQAQKNRVGSKNPNTELKIADRFYAESYFYTASEYYKDVVRQQPENRYATFWLAMSLLKARDYENAELFFQKFYSLQPTEKTNKKKWDEENEKLFNAGRYYYGEALHRNGKYDEAIDQLSKFKKEYKSTDETDRIKQSANLLIEGCNMAKIAPKAKVKVKSFGTGVNKSYTEASPYLYDDEVVYYSSLKVDANYKGDTLIFFEGPKSKRVYQIYKSVKAGNDWQRGKPLENTDINDPKYTIGNGTFNKAKTRFYFTKCLEVDDDRPLCNIFVADHKDGKFSNVQRIPEPINEKEKHTSTQPSVRTSDDGMEIIYFVSDRPGGVGGMDIWYFNRAQNGDFKGPKHLKGPANTRGDELTPYFDDSTKTLFFSSNGHPGFGGFDVFMTTETQDLGWSDIKNLGAPINTGADDLYYTRFSDQTKGLLVSNRLGSVPLNGIKTASDDIFWWENFKYGVQGLAFKEGAAGGGLLTDGLFKLYLKKPDGTKELVAIDSTSKGGSYFFKLNPDSDYEVEINREGFPPSYEDLTTKDLPDEDTVNVNLKVRKSLYLIYGTIVEAGTNTPVSDATVTISELFNNGMEKTVSYQTSSPNYRFEVDKDRKFKINVRKEGYFAANVEVVTSGTTALVDSFRKDIPIEKLILNKEYTLQNVLYEFGKATLTENSKLVLDMLYQIMIDNPTFVIELSSHTDAIGSDAANMKLSQARAQSCVDYLISKGITKNRLVAQGYGESKPKVPNTKEDGSDDPAGRAINRRTEFKILSN